MTRLHQNSTQIVIYMGWYGLCDDCESFSLKDSDTRDKIWKVWQTTSDHKNYIRFDATVPSFFDNIPNYQDFTELRCGYSYKIIMKKNTSESPQYIDIPNFVYTHEDVQPSGLLTNNCQPIPSSPTITPELYVDLVVRVEKQLEYDERTFDIVVTNQGNKQSSGEEVHQIFNKVVTSLSSNLLLSPHTVFQLISEGEPEEDTILIENFAEINATIIDLNKLKLSDPIQPQQEIYVKIKFSSFVPFVVKVDSENVVEEHNINVVDAEANNIAVVDSGIYNTPTPTESGAITSEYSFSFGIRENKTGGVSNDPTWLLGPNSFSILNKPILDLGSGRVRVYVSEKLKNGTETGKVDWVALLGDESENMTENIVIGANHNQAENMIVNKITSSEIRSFVATISSGRLETIGWVVEFDSDEDLLSNFAVPEKVGINEIDYHLQKVGEYWILTDENKSKISSGPTNGLLIYEQGTQIKVASSHPSWKIGIGTRVVLPIMGGGKFYTITEKTNNSTFIIDGTFSGLVNKYIAIDIPSFLLNTSNFMVSPSFQSVDEYKYWVTTGVGASWTTHPGEPTLPVYNIEYIEFKHQLLTGLF